jgi:hypothetical protein
VGEPRVKPGVWRPEMWAQAFNADFFHTHFPELLFTELIYQILYWIYEIAIHSRVFILDLPIRIGLQNLFNFFFFSGNWVVASLFDCLGKCGNA